MINELTLETVEDAAFESAEILFDYPEVATESWKDANPTKTRWISTPFIKKPFSPYVRDAMRSYYSKLAKELIPIAKKIVIDDAEVGRVDKIDADEIIEVLSTVDYNFLATKFADVKVTPSSTLYRDSDDDLQLAMTFNSDVTVDKIQIRKMRGDAVLIVALTRVWLQRNFFTTPGYMSRIGERLTDALNEATNNKYKGEVFLTVHGAMTDAAVSTSKSSSNEITLELNFIIPKKWCV